MANGTIAFDTLTTSDSVKSATEKSIDTSYIYNGVSKMNSLGYGGASQTFAAKESFNRSGWTDNGTGDYTYAITNDMANANYTPQCTNVTTGNYILIAHAVAVGTIQVKSRSDSTSAHDDPNGIAIFGDLA